MLSDEPIDEDLEALLYAQVYYGKQDIVEPERTELDSAVKDLEETARTGEFYVNKYNQQKKRYFEHNLVEEDKAAENEANLAKESLIEPPVIVENISSETLTNNLIPSDNQETFENPPQDNTLQLEKNQELTSTDTQSFIEISTSSPSTRASKQNSTKVVTNVPLLPSNQPQLLNNITINQYLYPPNFLEKLRSSAENLPLSKKCKRDLRKVEKGFLSEQEFFQKLKRRLKAQKKQQERIRKVYLNRQKTIVHSEVICLSDSDNSDIEIVEVTDISQETEQETEKKYLTMKTKGAATIENDSVDEDEIIYIAPPPVPVISVDTESESESSEKDIEIENKDKSNSKQDSPIVPATNTELSSEKPTVRQLDQDETSNDFLQPENTSENFNFSLHGSDFHNSEFVRPANPTDVYETESSTSTSDFNRDSTRQYCNTVKTIVFNEVDFPGQDIFEESNLETFGEFITPKRGTKEKNKNSGEGSVGKSNNAKEIRKINPRTSSESSSESEYESSTPHKNLPDLSPMVCTESSPKKAKKSKKKKNLDNTKSSKKKNKEKFTEENDGILDVESEYVRKLKRKSCEPALEDEETPKKKSKKRKNKSGKSVEEGENIAAAPNVNILSVSLKKGLKHNWVVTNSTPKKATEDVPNANVEDESSKKKKKRKKSSKNEDSEEVTIESATLEEQQQEKSAVVEDSGKKKTKKRKVRETSGNKATEKRKSVDEQSENAEEGENEATGKEVRNKSDDNGKKKNKKRKQKETSESRVIEETPRATHDETTSLTVEPDNVNTVCETQLALEKSASLEGSEVVEDNNSKKKNKMKKRTSLDKRVNLDGTVISLDDSGCTKDGESLGKEADGVCETQLALEKSVSLLEGSEVSEDNNSKKKNKMKKRTSLDKRVNVDETVITLDDSGRTKDGESLGKEASAKPSADSAKNNEEEEDIIIIEQVIPVHTIESSESEQEDILTLTDVGIGLDLELANISGSKAESKAQDKIMEDQDKIVEDSDRRFDIDYIQSKMSDDPEKWKILSTDRYNLNIAKRGPRCNKCRQFGHVPIRCPNKPQLPVCTLCAETGHQEPRCPNKVCFTCGKRGNFSTVYCYKCVAQRKSTCNLCNIIGHETEYCPDLWRRYFLTTKPGPLKVPKGTRPTLKPQRKQWCSGCASNGHLEFECDDYNWMREYPASSPHIFKYNDVYAQLRKRDQVEREKELQSTASEAWETSQEKSTADNSRSNEPTTSGSQLEKSPEEIQEGNNTQNTEIIQQTANDKPAESPNDSVANQSEIQQSNENQAEGIPKESQQDTDREQSCALTETDHLGNQSSAAYQEDSAQPQRNSGSYRRPIRRSSRLAKINPVSVLRQSSSYAPYQSVLNPYSLGAAPDRGLFNSVPNNILAQQLVQLATAAGYQNTGNFNRNVWNHPEPDYYQMQQYGSQIPPNPTPLFDNYRDFYSPHNPGSYYDARDYLNRYDNSNFMNRPYTITRNPHGERDFRDRGAFDRDRGGGGRDWRDREVHFSDLRYFDRTETEVNDSSERMEMGRQAVETSNMEFIPLTNEVAKNDIPILTNYRSIFVDTNTRRRFESGEPSFLRKLISEEIEELNDIPLTDGKLYKNKLFIIDNLKKVEKKTKSVRKQMWSLYKQINMYLFGVHKLGEGSKHLDFLRNFGFYPPGRLNRPQRLALLDAYRYVFGRGEHPNFNYRHYLNKFSVKYKN